MFRTAVLLCALHAAVACSSPKQERFESRSQTLDQNLTLGTPFLLDPVATPTEPTAADERTDPALAVGADGSMLVAWLELQGNRWAVFAARVDASLTASSPVLVGEASYEGRPAVVSEGDSFLLAWNGPDGKLWGARVTDNGTVGVSGVLTMEPGGRPVLLPQGSATRIVWPSEGAVYTAVIDATGPLALNSKTLLVPAGARAITQVAAAASSTELLVASEMAREDGETTSQLSFLFFNASNPTSTPDRVFTEAAAPDGPLSVAINADGRALVLWSDAVASGQVERNVIGVLVSRKEDLIRVNALLPDDGSADQRWPVVLPSTNGFMATWIEMEPSTWVSGELTSDGAGPTWTARKAYELQPERMTWCTFSLARGADSPIGAVVTGGAPGARVELWKIGATSVVFGGSATGGNASQQLPAAAYDAAGDRHLVVWQESRGAQRDIRGNWVVGGAASDSSIEIADSLACDDWGPAVAEGGGKVLVAWRARCDSGLYVKAKVLGSEAAPVSIPASAAGTLAAGALGNRFVLVWDSEPFMGGTPELRYAWIGSDGTKSGEDTVISPLGREAPRASIGCNASRCLVAWNERTEDTDAHVDYVTAALLDDGEKSLFQLDFPAPGERTHDALPSVAADGEGFLVFFRDQTDWDGGALRAWRLNPEQVGWSLNPPASQLATWSIDDDAALTSPVVAAVGASHVVAFASAPKNTAWARLVPPAPFLDELRVGALPSGSATMSPAGGVTVVGGIGSAESRGAISSTEFPVLSPQDDGRALLVAVEYDPTSLSHQVLARMVQVGEAQGADGGIPDAGAPSDAGNLGDARSSDLYGCSSAGGGRAGLLALLLAGAAAMALRRRRGALLLALVVLALPRPSVAAPKRARVAVLALEVASGVDASVGDLLTEQLATAIQQHLGEPVLSSKDIRNALGFERERQLLGCSEDSCLTELGGALGVDYLVSGSLGKLGSVLLFNVRCLDMRRMIVLERFSERVPLGRQEAYLDAIDRAATRLIPRRPSATAVPAAVPVAAAADAGASTQWGLGLRFQARPVDHLSGAWTLSAALRPAPAFELSVGAQLTGALDRAPAGGALARAAWVPLAGRASISPVLALEVPVLVSPDLAVGAGAALGVEWRPASWLVLGLHVPAHYFFVAPDGSDRFYYFVAPSLSLVL